MVAEKNHSREYYPVSIKYLQKELFLLWFSDDIDGVVVEKNKILIFASMQEILAYSKTKNIDIVIDAITLYNFDKITLWLSKYKNEKIICHEILNIWNFFTDISKSLNIKFIGNNKDKITNKIYNKLFWGSNLPSVTPKGKFYIPIWRKSKRKKLAKILTEAMLIFKNYIHI